MKAEEVYVVDDGSARTGYPPRRGAPRGVATINDEKLWCGIDEGSACDSCGFLMEPEHQHYRCPNCGWRDSCCF